MKTVEGFNLKRTPSIILIQENSFKLGIVVLVMLNKMVGYRFIYRLLLLIWVVILKPQSFNLCPFLILSVRNGPSVSFRTNVPCNNHAMKKALLRENFFVLFFFLQIFCIFCLVVDLKILDNKLFPKFIIFKI